jgi:hypothetical protein
MYMSKCRCNLNPKTLQAERCRQTCCSSRGSAKVKVGIKHGAPALLISLVAAESVSREFEKRKTGKVRGRHWKEAKEAKLHRSGSIRSALLYGQLRSSHHRQLLKLHFMQHHFDAKRSVSHENKL